MESFTYFDFTSHRTGLTGDEFIFWVKYYLVTNRLGVNPHSSSPHLKKILEEILASESPQFRHELNEYRRNLAKQCKSEQMLNETYSDIVDIFNNITEEKG